MSGREYLEVTLHMNGGAKIVFAAEKFTSKRNLTGDGYTGLEWTHADWDDLPSLHSVNLPDLQAITSIQIRDRA